MDPRPALAALLAGSLAVAASAGFEIKPAGPQVLDPASGVVSLPQGGTVRSVKLGVTVQAATVELKQDEFLRATGATVTGADIGTIRAPRIDYQIKADRMALSGGLSYTSALVKDLTAEKGAAYPDAARVVVLGGVKAGSPRLTADAMVVDLGRREVFLSGNFTYLSPDGLTRLTSRKGDRSLLLSFPAGLNSGKGTTDIPRGRLESYLALIERSR